MSRESRWTYKAIRNLTGFACVLIAIFVIVDLLSTSIDVLGSLLFDTWVVPDVDYSSVNEWLLTTLMGWLGIASLPVFLAAVVTFCMWMYRAAANIRALGEEYAAVTPGWAAGWWFMPILQLWKPLGAMREIYQSSASAVDGELRPLTATPSLLGGWWALWLLSNFFGNIYTGTVLGRGSGPVAAAAWIGVASTMLSMGAAACVVTIITRVSRWQGSAASVKAPTPFGGRL